MMAQIVTAVGVEDYIRSQNQKDERIPEVVQERKIERRGKIDPKAGHQCLG